MTLSTVELVMFRVYIPVYIYMYMLIDMRLQSADLEVAISLVHFKGY